MTLHSLRRKAIPALFACILSAPISFAQATPKPAAEKLPVYDVVSIRENKNGRGMRWQYGADSFVAENITLEGLLTSAYGMRSDQISGLPPWVESFHFNMEAKVSDPDDIKLLKHLKSKQRMAMLLPILTERFGLKAHTETKEMATYDLLLAKGGTKLVAVPPPPPNEDGTPKPRGSYSVGNGTINATELALSALANQLANELERTVVDKTGLTGNYTYKLTWTDADETPTDTAPSLFTALQEQLGLRLQPSRGPVEILVVDHADMPKSNDD